MPPPDANAIPKPHTPPDAVKVPREYYNRDNVPDRLAVARLKREFGPLLARPAAPAPIHADPAATGFYSRAAVGHGYSFVTRRLDDTELFPVGHPYHPRPRYDWTDRGDGVQFGHLIPDPFVDDPDVQEVVTRSQEDRKAAAVVAFDEKKKDPAFREKWFGPGKGDGPVN